MPYIIRKTTLEDVRADKPKKIYYSMATCWWTHRAEDLRRTPKTEMPCDPRGGMLLESHEPEEFLKAAEENPEAYGKYGLEAFVASHNDNCVVNTLMGTVNTCLRTWEEYNELLDKIDEGEDDRSNLRPFKTNVSWKD